MHRSLRGLPWFLLSPSSSRLGCSSSTLSGSYASILPVDAKLFAVISTTVLLESGRSAQPMRLWQVDDAEMTTNWWYPLLSFFDLLRRLNPQSPTSIDGQGNLPPHQVLLAEWFLSGSYLMARKTQRGCNDISAETPNYDDYTIYQDDGTSPRVGPLTTWVRGLGSKQQAAAARECTSGLAAGHRCSFVDVDVDVDVGVAAEKWQQCRVAAAGQSSLQLAACGPE